MNHRRALASLFTPLLTALVGAQGLFLGPNPPPAPQPLHEPPHHIRPGRPIRHVPRRPMIRLTSLKVEAEIVDGVATTQLRQVFRNDGGRIGEGTWILPLPPGSAADRFTMTVNGVEMVP